MPELPEVETMVRGLLSRVKGKQITDLWADEKKLIHHPSFRLFKESLIGQQITNIERRGKIIIFHLQPKGFWLAHPKMTGHFLFLESKPDDDFIKEKSVHLSLSFSDKTFLAWSDQRKFSRLEYWSVDNIAQIPWLRQLGLEPLKMSFAEFNQLIEGRRQRIKSWLMDQRFIVGVGNIYASEVLWLAQVNPERPAGDLSSDERKKIFQGLQKMFKKAIIKKGTSLLEYRDIEDQKGEYANYLQVYGRKGQPCPRCQGEIVRKMIGSRSTYYCPQCQP